MRLFDFASSRKQSTRALKRENTDRRRFALREAAHTVMEQLETRTMLSVSLQSGVLTVNGTSGNDQIALAVDGNDNTLLDVSVNGALQATPAAVSVNQIQVSGLVGNDVFTVDDSNGNPIPAQGIAYDGGDGFDTLAVDGSAPGSTAYTPGPGGGTFTLTTAGVTGTIAATNIEPVLDNVTSATATVNGTNASNAINYKQGPGGGSFVGTTGLVSIDNLETYEFNNKTNLVINTLAGTDTIDLNNPAVPAGMTGTITVNGGDATAGDTLIVSGRVNATDAFTYSPATTTSDTGSVVDTGLPTVNFTGMGALNINGQNGGSGGAGDSLTISTSNLSTGQREVLTPGTQFDSGHVDFHNRPGGVNPTGVPVDFSKLGITGNLLFTDVGQFDNLIYNGSDLNDTFTVNASGQVNLNDQIPVSTASIISLTLAGLGGVDTFNIAGNQNLSGNGGIGVIVEGDPSSSGVLNFNGSGAAISVNLGAQTIGQSGSSSVEFSGIANANVAAGAASVAVTATGGNDSIAVTPTAASAATLTNSGANTIFNFSNIATTAGSLSLDPLGGANTVTVNGAVGANNIVAASTGGSTTSVQVNLLQTISLVTADVTALSIDGSNGNDNLTVNSTNGAVMIPITYDGGGGFNALSLIGGTETTDTCIPGVQIGAGADTLVFAGGTESINFVNLAPIFDSVAGPLSVSGTSANNTVNYSNGYNSLANFLSNIVDTAWGQVGVDSYEPIEFINKTTLTINSASGDDTITLDNPNTPTSLTAISVNSGPGLDTLIANAFFTPVTNSNVSSSSLAVAGQPPVNYTTEYAKVINALDSINVTPVVINGQEGAALNNISVGTFTGGAVGAVAGDFNASINWGDGTTSPGTVSGSAGSFAVTGSHVYAVHGTYFPVVTVTDSQTVYSSLVSNVYVTVLYATPLSAPINDTAQIAVSATISGTVFSDLNGNGVMDSGESGVSSWQVYLDINNDGILDVGDVLANTNASGNYSFTGLPSGSYTVRAIPVSGWGQTLPSSNSGRIVSATAGQTVTGIRFGEEQDIASATALPTPLFTGDSYALNLAFSGLHPATSWIINWGDGTAPQTVTGSPSSVLHAFSLASGAAPFAISALANSADGAVSAAPLNIMVYNAPVLSGGTLSLTGTSGNDIANFSVNAGIFAVNFNGASRMYNSSLVTKASYAENGGNDTITNNTTSKLNITTASTGKTTINATAGTTIIPANSGTGVQQLAFAAINISSGAKVVFANSSATLGDYSHHANRNVAVIDAGGLNISSGGTLDMGDNDLILHYLSANETSARNLVSGSLASGFDGGAFDTAGINSSEASYDANFGSGTRALGWMDNNDIGATTFDGVNTSDLNEVMIKFTYYGDSDLSGTVDATDFGLFAAGKSNAGTGWAFGNYDYNSTTADATDFGLFAAGLQGYRQFGAL